VWLAVTTITHWREVSLLLHVSSVTQIALLAMQPIFASVVLRVTICMSLNLSTFAISVSKIAVAAIAQLFA